MRYIVLAAILFLSSVSYAGKPKFRVLALYTTTVEPDHVHFANDAIKFYTKLASEKGFQFDTTTDWKKLNDTDLKPYQVVVWLNDFPQTPEQRAAFERYMQRGGGWLGTHVAGYNDQYTKWPWFVDFLGGGMFYSNNWPPAPASLLVDTHDHPVTKNLPAGFTSPSNEWYMFVPTPRANPHVKVLLTLSPNNYPLGTKDILTTGDNPVVWTNTGYRMIYMNMGHGDKIFDSEVQNTLFANALIWLGTGGHR